MNKTKGFTLIELLAVIIIIAVISLIATPIITNVIEDAETGAAIDSMYSYVKAVEISSMQNYKPGKLLTGLFTTADANLKDGSTEVLKVQLKGTRPTDGFGEIELKKGVVVYSLLEFDGYKIEYENHKAHAYEEPKKYKVGDVVYFDPTKAENDCRSGNEWRPNNPNTTCYKWNVVKDNGTNIEMLLDHNLGKKTEWISNLDFINAGGGTATTQYGPITVINQLKRDTEYWTNIILLSSADNVVRKNGSIEYEIKYEGMKARIMGPEEMINLEGKVFVSSSNIIGLEFPMWVQNISQSITDTIHYGYWLDTAYSSTYAWNARVTATNPPGVVMDDSETYTTNYYGVRPVVRVKKNRI